MVPSMSKTTPRITRRLAMLDELDVAVVAIARTSP
jgi:hypothetical protein